jgi:THO complex subunit 4
LIQDYFGKTIGHVKKVFLTYGPSGRSRGIAQIIFAGPKSGPEAAKKLDGVKVDNRAMRVSSRLLSPAHIQH